MIYPVLLVFTFLTRWRRSDDEIQNGCRVHGQNETHVTCHCNHLTNFAVIMETQKVGQLDPHCRFGARKWIGCGIRHILSIGLNIFYSKEKGWAWHKVHLKHNSRFHSLDGIGNVEAKGSNCVMPKTNS